MLEINGTNIKMTSGDTPELTITCGDMVIGPSDTVILTIRKKPTKDSAVLLSKAALNGVFHFTQADTASIKADTYFYDVVVKRGTSRYTLFSPSLFVIEEGLSNE